METTNSFKGQYQSPVAKKPGTPPRRAQENNENVPSPTHDLHASKSVAQYLPVHRNIQLKSKPAITSTEAKEIYDPMTTAVYGTLPSLQEITNRLEQSTLALPLPENKVERKAYISKRSIAILHSDSEHNTDETDDILRASTLDCDTPAQDTALPPAQVDYQKNRTKSNIVAGDKSPKESVRINSQMTAAIYKKDTSIKTIALKLKPTINNKPTSTEKDNSKKIPMMIVEDMFEKFAKSPAKYDNPPKRQGTSPEPDYEFVEFPNLGDYSLPSIPQNEPLNENIIDSDGELLNEELDFVLVGGLEANASG